MVGPISGLSDGFNNVFAAHFWRMATYRGELVVGTNDWAYLSVLAYPELAPWAVDLIEVVLTGERGFDLWASCDGVNWRAITRDAFGGDRYDFGARNLIPVDGRLFVGSANLAQGTKVWAYRANGCSGTATAADAPKRARPPIPRALMADVQKDGTVLSWHPAAAPAGTRYRVMRATYTDVQLGLSPPAVMANGFPLEGALPELRAGGEGLEDRRPAGHEGLRPDWDGRRAVFHRPDGATRRALRLPGGGRGALGRALCPVKRAGCPGSAARPGTPRFRRAPSGAAATMSHVADDAVARRAMLRRLARLRRAAPPGSDRQLLLERLERRVRYAGIADGP